MHPIRRLKAYARQCRKERSNVWMPRLAQARAGCWGRLNTALADGSLDEAKFGRFERHMRRLGQLTLPAERWDYQVVATIFYLPITLVPQMPSYEADQSRGNRSW